MTHTIQRAIQWIQIDADWFESLNGKFTLLNDPDIGWTLLDSDDLPPLLLGQYSTQQQALAQAQFQAAQ